MDSIALLAREEQFKKLNKQLEKRTESLMKEIEHVMQKQDIFTDISQSTLTRNHGRINYKNNTKISEKQHIITKSNHKITKNNNNSLEHATDQSGSCNFENGTQKLEIQDNDVDKYCYCCTSKGNNGIRNDDLSFLYAFVNVNVKEKVLPQSFLKDRISIENVCKFLSSKIKLLQEQTDKLQSTISIKASQCEKHLTYQAELESERLTLLSKMNNIKSCSADVKAKYMALEKRHEEKDRAYKELRSETDKLTAELKRLKTQNASLESRFSSRESTIDDLKRQLENAKVAEKEFRDSSRSLSASHQNAISRLEAKSKTLTATIQQQRALIENLKQQNALLITDGAVKALEKEFNKILMKDF